LYHTLKQNSASYTQIF